METQGPLAKEGDGNGSSFVTHDPLTYFHLRAGGLYLDIWPGSPSS